MPEKIVDLHTHSRYSRACSKDLELPKIAIACEKKGIDIVVTGDFTHPAWMQHIKDNLVEENNGIFKLKDNSSVTRFILGTEISCIYKHSLKSRRGSEEEKQFSSSLTPSDYKHKDATRRVHLLILAPSIKAVEKFNTVLEKRGVNLRADGRPIMGLSAKTILQILLDIDPGFMLIPAHAWTPWFGILGSKSGYDRIEDCFEELTPHIRAIETGLSSDPMMNHRLSMLDTITLVSNSDAHSANNLGREANVLNLSSGYDFAEITNVLKTGDKKKFLYTIEFYPEEGKYHFDGHAPCKIALSPKETKAKNFLCPNCKKKVTVGVLHRVDDLADRDESKISPSMFVPHRYIVPLKEIISNVFSVGVASKKVIREYESMISSLGSEFDILLHKKIEEIEKHVSNRAVAQAISNMREGKVKATPGYDGIFGSVKVILKESTVGKT